MQADYAAILAGISSPFIVACFLVWGVRPLSLSVIIAITVMPAAISYISGRVYRVHEWSSILKFAGITALVTFVALSILDFTSTGLQNFGLDPAFLVIVQTILVIAVLSPLFAMTTKGLQSVEKRPHLRSCCKRNVTRAVL